MVSAGNKIRKQVAQQPGAFDKTEKLLHILRVHYLMKVFILLEGFLPQHPLQNECFSVHVFTGITCQKVKNRHETF